MEHKLRKSGIDIIGDVPWATHFCQFYQTKKDLLDILVPYFKAGLEKNEFCMWITAEPLVAEEARRAMVRAVPTFSKYVKRGQIEILPHTEWYLKGGSFDSQRVLDGWVEKLNQALAKGYEGLRLTGNTFWLEEEDWKSFADYEAAINGVIGRYNMLALCTYCLDRCSAAEIIDVIRNHEFALIKQEGKWDLIESSIYKQAKEALAASEAKYRQLIENIQEGIWVIDKDAYTTFVNPHLAEMLGYSVDEMVGKHLFSFLDEQGVAIVKQRLERRRAGIREQLDFEFHRKDGTPLHAIVSASPLTDEEGNYIGAIAGIVDVTERKRLEERYSTMVRTAMDGFWLTDAKGKFLDVNDGYCRLTGYSREELLGMSVTDVEARERPEETARHIERIKQNGYDRFETRHRGKDGRIIDIEVSTNFTDIEGGRFFVFLRDITDRKRAEEAVKESQHDLSHAQAVARIGSWRLDIQRNELMWSDETYRLFGIPRGTPMTYEKFLATVHPEDRQYVDQKWQAALRGEDYDIEHRIVVGNEVKWVREKAELELEQGVIKSGFGTVQDITERKQAEEALRESQGELATILASVPILTLAVDPDRRVLKANDAAAKFAGRPAEEMVGLRGGEALRCLHSMDDPRGCGFGPSCRTCKVRLSVLDTFETGNSHYQVEWHLPFLRDGKQEEITFLLSTVPIATPKKQVLLCIQDITERKQAEEEVRRLNESLQQRAAELEAANKELESFSYSVSHDLRAPLRSMDGFSQALLEDYADKLDNEGRDYLKRIKDSASHMAQLIDDMLELSRLTRVSMRLESVNLSELAEAIASELKKAQPEREAEFAIKPGMVAYGDARLLRVVLENLLDNAWKFTAKIPQAKIEVGTTEYEGKEVYFVRDNGAGFDMAYAGKLFVPFQRLHRTTEYPGTGVGLATVKRLIYRHGGDVWAGGEVGKGATFYFTLP